MQECKGTNVFSNLKIGVRLAIGFAVLIVMMLAVGLTALGGWALVLAALLPVRKSH